MDSKEELERRKLELEIAELDKPLWLRPAYLAVALPIVLSILAFLSALLSGYFDRERAALRVEIRQLSDNRDSLKRERDQLAVDRDFLMKHIADSIKKMDSQIKETEKWTTEIENMARSPSPTATAAGESN